MKELVETIAKALADHPNRVHVRPVEAEHVTVFELRVDPDDVRRIIGRQGRTWVWPAPTQSGHMESSSLKKQHLKALKVSRVRRFVLYSLRHTFLSRLGESGCDAWTLARIAGHNSVAISSRYVHPSHDAVLAAVERLGGHNSGHSEESQLSQVEMPKLVTH